MVTEQIVYECKGIDPNMCYKAAAMVPDVTCDAPGSNSNRGILTIHFKKFDATIQITPRGKIMLYSDSNVTEDERKALWDTTKPILRTGDNKAIALQEIRWLDRIMHPNRVESLVGVDDGSVEFQLSVQDELRRKTKTKKAKRAS
jgi:hypothetical protein